MKRRLSRAKAKIKATGIPFAVPDAHLLPDRIDAVLAVIYLIYNEGYRGRVDLGAEAIRLGQVLAALMPDEPEAHGLLALMMIHHARRRARFSGDDLVLLDDQDRSLWDTDRIAAGRAVLDRAIPLGGRGAYVLQRDDMNRDFDDAIAVTGHWTKYGVTYAIPFRSLRTDEVDNLLVAGRCISVDHRTHHATKEIPPSMATGEAAGTAAALAARRGVALRDLPVTELRDLLRAAGAIVDRPA